METTNDLLNNPWFVSSIFFFLPIILGIIYRHAINKFTESMKSAIEQHVKDYLDKREKEKKENEKNNEQK